MLRQPRLLASLSNLGHTGMPRPLVLLPLLLALVALPTGCGGRQQPPPPDAFTDPIAVYEAVLTRLETLQSARIRATLEYFGDGGRVRARQAVLVSAPSSVRLETISPFDTTLSVFLLNDSELIHYDLQHRNYVSGAPTEENIALFVPFRLSPTDLVRILLGGPPLDAVDPDPDAYTLAWNRRAGAYDLVMPLVDGGTLAAQIQHATWVLVGAEVRDQRGQLQIELRGGHFEPVGGDGPDAPVMPRKLRFLMPAEGIDVSLDVERVELNVPLPAALFTLDPPPGVEVRPL